MKKRTQTTRSETDDPSARKKHSRYDKRTLQACGWFLNHYASSSGGAGVAPVPGRTEDLCGRSEREVGDKWEGERWFGENVTLWEKLGSKTTLLSSGSQQWMRQTVNCIFLQILHCQKPLAMRLNHCCCWHRQEGLPICSLYLISSSTRMWQGQEGVEEKHNELQRSWHYGM